MSMHHKLVFTGRATVAFIPFSKNHRTVQVGRDL